MKRTKELLERVEKVNEHGVTIINELYLLKKSFRSKDGIEKVMEKEFVWYQTTGDHTRIFCSYKTEKKMREKMAQCDFNMDMLNR